MTGNSSSWDDSDYEPTSYLAPSRYSGVPSKTSRKSKKEKSGSTCCVKLKWVLCFSVLISIALSVTCLVLFLRIFLETSRRWHHPKPGALQAQITDKGSKLTMSEILQFMEYQTNKTLQNVESLQREVFGAFGIMGWHRASNKHWYKLSKERWNYEQARSYCAGIGARLAMISNAIRSELKKAFKGKSSALWIAGCPNMSQGRCCMVQQPDWTENRATCTEPHIALCEAIIQ